MKRRPKPKARKKPMTIEELIERSSGGRAPDPGTDLRASMLFLVSEDPFTLWCHFHAPREELHEEISRYDRTRSEFVKKIRNGWVASNYPSVFDVKQPAGPGEKPDEMRATLEAMLRGEPAIRHARLLDLKNNAYGTADLLVKDTSAPSDLGAYHYRIVEFKCSGDVKDHHALRGALFNRILGTIQNLVPDSFTIVLRDFSETKISQSGMEQRLDEITALWKNIRDGSFRPEPGRPPSAARPPWRIYANKLTFERGELVLIAGTGPDVREKLKKAGVADIAGISSAGPAKIREILGDSAGSEIYNCALAYSTDRPVKRKDAVYSPERGKRNLYFDFETSDDTHPDEPPHTYLIGLWDLEKEKYVSFLADGAKEEEKIFRDFIDYIGSFESARLYHWTNYEIGQMKEVMKRHRILETPFKELFKSCVDLKEAVKKAFYIPAPSFSLKAVAPALGFNWRQKDVGAMESMVYYWDWLEGDKEAIGKVLMYNEDDCVAMLQVDKALSPPPQLERPEQEKFKF